MRSSSFVATTIACLLSVTALAACDDHAHLDYETLQDCMVDHTQVEMLLELQALTVCLVDHYDLGWATATACDTYVAANGGYPNSRAAACAEYIRQKGL